MNYYQIDSKNINSNRYEMPHTVEIVNDELDRKMAASKKAAARIAANNMKASSAALNAGRKQFLNRKGRLEKYAIMTITVAMLSNKFKKYVTPLEIGEDGASVKKKAKTIEGSTFLEDKRKG